MKMVERLCIQSSFYTVLNTALSSASTSRVCEIHFLAATPFLSTASL